MVKPIYLFGGGGFVMGSMGVLFAMMTLYKKLYLGIYVKDQPLFQISIFFLLVGFQLILLGLLAEVLIRIYFDSEEHTPYYVAERVGWN